MVKNYVPPGEQLARCPSCGTALEAVPAGRDRNIQCPNCQEVIHVAELAVEESHAGDLPAHSANLSAGAARIAALEARVSAIEAALAGRMEGGAGAESVEKLLWFEHTDGDKTAYSSEQGKVLAHNLRTVRARKIVIRVSAASPLAHVHAGWFREVFELAGWSVFGPEELPPGTACDMLELAVPELPVTHDAAKTYLALKAAGFEAMPVLEPALAEGEQAPLLALILPASKST